MVVTISFSADALDLCIDKGSVTAPLTRPLNDKDFASLSAWVAEYGSIVGRSGIEAQLLDLGRALFDWLDGGERWLVRLLEQAPSPFLVEFSVPTIRPDERQRTFLQLPFELLANEDGYLAKDAGLLYCAVRRLGVAGSSLPLGDHCLGLTFMAAAPRGAGELDYGAEENAILEATEGLELDREAFDKAAPLIIEAYQIVDHLGRLEGICAVSMHYGQILHANDKPEEGLAVLRRAEDGYRKMHRYQEADGVKQLIAALPGS